VTQPPRPDPTRTLVVVSERPHPWALLRDRLDPELVQVAWAPPDRLATVLTRHLAGVWTVAGDATMPGNAFAILGGRLVAVLWVGHPPPGMPLCPLAHQTWGELASHLARVLSTGVHGLRLAPGRGILLPGGDRLMGAFALEALLAAHPAGLRLEGDQRRGLAAARRGLARSGLPLRVSCRAGHVSLRPCER
jgi:hypothetical protein